MENYSLSSCFSLVGKGSLSELLSSFCGVLGIDPGVWCVLTTQSPLLVILPNLLYSSGCRWWGGVGAQAR